MATSADGISSSGPNGSGPGGDFSAAEPAPPAPPAPSERPPVVTGSVAIVLAAGKGTRMRSDLPKVLHEALGAPILRFALDALDDAGVVERIVIVGHRREEVEAAFAGRAGVRFAEQREQRGTGDAVSTARAAWEALGAPDLVLVTCGDAPLVTGATLRALLEAHASAGAAVTVLTAEVPDPTGYGRIVRDAASGLVARIVEERDADAAERAVREVNAGAYAFRADALWAALAAGAEAYEGRGARGEHYLTDTLAWLRGRGEQVAALRAADWREVLGVNTQRELREAQAVLAGRVIDRLVASGVDIPHPDKVVIEVDVEVGAGTRIEPFSVLERGVRVGRGCEVGPFARLGSGTVLEDGAVIGNFVEVKRSRIGARAKAKHLAYLGDGEVGAGANIGAGTIFCNYDGAAKHKTVVGAKASLGSGSLLVAPCEVGAGARTGAGAVLRRGDRIPDGATWVGVPARPVPSKSKS